MATSNEVTTLAATRRCPIHDNNVHVTVDIIYEQQIQQIQIVLMQVQVNIFMFIHFIWFF